MSDGYSLLEVNSAQRLAGFGNVFRIESRRWWRTSRWWVQSVIWLVIINGLVMIADFWSEESREAILSRGTDYFFLLILIFPVIGLAIMMQGIIVGEKRSGTADWILSKPVSRTAFLLAKSLANLLPALLIMIVLQTGIAYLQISSAASGFFPIAPFLGKMIIAALNLLFYHALIVMLGTLFQRRGPVAGIPLALLIGQLLLVDLLPAWCVNITPSAFIATASGATTSPDSVTLVVISVWVFIFTVVALWRFNREQF